MARPKIDFEISYPKMKSPGKGREDETCGADWDINVEIRAPYKNVDKYLNVLPIIFAKYEALSGTLSDSLPIMVSRDFQDALRDAIDGATELLFDYNNAGYMDSKNRSSIDAMIDKARKYFEYALALQNYWESYSSDPGKGPVGWRLEDELARDGCEYKAAPEKGGIFTMTKDGAKTVNFTCPTDTDKDHHESDRQTFFKLMEAAMRTCRCAQEAAAAVGSYFRNKEHYDSQPGAGMGVQFAPKKAAPKMGVAQMMPIEPEEEPEEEPPEIPEVEPEEEPPPPPPAKKKKKDNTLLIAGAAALGLLMLKK